MGGKESTIRLPVREARPVAAGELARLVLSQAGADLVWLAESS